MHKNFFPFFPSLSFFLFLFTRIKMNSSVAASLCHLIAVIWHDS